MVVWAWLGGGDGEALYVGKRSFRRIDGRGEGIFVSGTVDPEGLDMKLDINQRGQVIMMGKNYYESRSGVGIFSPRSGWRGLGKLESTHFTGEAGQISSSGRAVLSNGLDVYLSDFPKPLVRLTCLVPQNTVISSSRVGDLYILEGARFLHNDDVLFSADVRDDGSARQLYLLSQRGSGQAVAATRDYCLEVQLEREMVCQSGDQAQSCSGKLTVASSDGRREGVKVSLYAQQTLAGETSAECDPILIDTFTSSAVGTSYVVKTDPQFDYYFIISDPQYVRGDVENEFVRYGTSDYRNASSACRAPFEGVRAAG